ncbi:MAG: SusD/RagB family nutrient-binding outer membrane lipoprotein [Saprospiraceae bacterium]|nr:SusD/RagB family nutrient-binding outer membrane lipoprotein [Saprospiraceae bacterium]
MKNKLLKLSSLVLLLALMAQGCTKDFEEINTDPTAASADIYNPNYLLTRAQLGYMGSTDFAYETWRVNLIYCSTMMQHLSNVNGYWVGDKTRNNLGYENAYFERCYDEQVKYIVDCVEQTRGNAARSNVHNVARITRVLIFHRLTDLYGDVPYSQAGLGFYQQIYSPAYDAQADIYDNMLRELEEASDALDASGDPVTGDLIYNGDLAKWKKFANSLMLRLAMRHTKRDIGKAQAWAEKAAGRGVMTSNADNAFILGDAATDRQTPCRNSIVMNLSYEIPNMRLSQTFVNWMKSHSDPRLFVFGENTDGTTDPNTTLGMPNGYDLASQPISGAPGYPGSVDGYLRPRLSVIGKLTGPTFFQTYAEVEFLLAEAAQRGWSVGGSAQSHYEAGVRAAMTHLDQYDAAGTLSSAQADAYLQQNPFDAANALTQINEQYWACTFLNEYEAFANWRRTGIPNLTPTSFPGDITGGQIPRRMRYPTAEYSSNGPNIEAAVARQGADINTTRVWWDQ